MVEAADPLQAQACLAAGEVYRQAPHVEAPGLADRRGEVLGTT